MNTQNQIAADDAFYTRPQLADLLGCTVQHLENLATCGDGPPMVKFGRSVRYSRAAFVITHPHFQRIEKWRGS
jgi:hypothetical protein